MKFSRGLVVLAAIPILAACGNSSTTAQIPVSASNSPSPMSSSHSPTSSKSAPSSTRKASIATSAPIATSHVNAAPVIAPAPVHTTSVQNTPVQNNAAPATTHPASSAPATHVAPAPTNTSSTPTPHTTVTSKAITPGGTKAPVVVAPTSGTTKPVTAAKTPFTAAIADATGPIKGSSTKHLSDGTWTVDVTGINATSVTVDVLGPATGNCTDDCLEPIGTETIPLASINIPTVLPMKITVNGWVTQGITAPAWVYAEIFSQGQTGLNNAITDPHYTISSALKAKIDPTFGSEKDVYSHITIKNGVVTNLKWTYHP